jgi:hypothetical protein
MRRLLWPKGSRLRLSESNRVRSARPARTSRTTPTPRTRSSTTSSPPAPRKAPGRIAGTLKGELSAGTYDLEFAALLRKDFATAFTAITGASLTIAGSGPTYTVTRATGDFLTGGVKRGMVVA